MHSEIRQDDKDARENRQADGIPPQGEDVEAEAAQDGRAGDFDVEPVLVVNEG